MLGGVTYYGSRARRELLLTVLLASCWGRGRVLPSGWCSGTCAARRSTPSSSRSGSCGSCSLRAGRFGCSTVGAAAAPHRPGVRLHRLARAAGRDRAASALMAALYLFLKFSRTASDACGGPGSRAAALQGVNIEAMSALGFGIGCALAGAAGALLAPVFAVSPTMGALPVVKAFIIIIVGGMGSLPGAVLGGLLLGAVEGIGTLFMSSAAVNMLASSSSSRSCRRPRGLFGVGREGRRRLGLGLSRWPRRVRCSRATPTTSTLPRRC